MRRRERGVHERLLMMAVTTELSAQTPAVLLPWVRPTFHRFNIFLVLFFVFTIP